MEAEPRAGGLEQELPLSGAQLEDGAPGGGKDGIPVAAGCSLEKGSLSGEMSRKQSNKGTLPVLVFREMAEVSIRRHRPVPERDLVSLVSDSSIRVRRVGVYLLSLGDPKRKMSLIK